MRRLSMIQKNWIITDYCKKNIKQLGFIYDEKTDYWKYSFLTVPEKRSVIEIMYGLMYLII